MHLTEVKNLLNSKYLKTILLVGFTAWCFLLFYVYSYQTDHIRTITFQTLESSSKYKQSLIEQWFEDHINHLSFIAENPEFIDFFANRQTDPEAQRVFLQRLHSLIEIYGYQAVLVLNQDRHLERSLNEIPESSLKHLNEKSAIYSTKHLYVTKQFYDLGHYHLHIVTKIRKNEQILGFLVFHIDPHPILHTLIKTWPYSSTSAESILISKEENTLTLLHRRRSDADKVEFMQIALKSPLMKKIQQFASSDKESMRLSARDYRGKEVFAYAQKLPDLPWVLISKIDTDEATLPQRKTFLLLGILVPAILLLTLFFWKTVLENRVQRHKNLLIKRSRRHYLKLYMDAPFPYQSLNRQGKILNINRAWSRMLGYSREEVIGRQFSEFLQPDSIPLLNKRLPKFFKEGCVKDVIFHMLCKSNKVLTIKINGRISVNPENNLPVTHCILIDITKQLETENRKKRELKRKEALLALAVDSASVDKNTLMSNALDEIESITESTVGFVHFVSEDQNEIELVAWSKSTKTCCHADFEQHYPLDKAGIWADCVKTQQAVVINDYPNYQSKRGQPEGHAELTRFISMPVFKLGKVRMIMGVGNKESDYDEFDIESVQLFASELYQVTQLKETYNALKSSERRFHNLFEKAPIAYMALSSAGDILSVNQAWMQIFAPKSHKQDFIGKNFGSFLTRQTAEQFNQLFASLCESNQTINEVYQIQTYEDQTREIEITGRSSQNEKGQEEYHYMLVDVTEKHRLQKAHQLAAKVFENAGEGLMVTDADQKILMVNQAFTDILGYSAEEAVGQTPQLLHSGLQSKTFYQQMWDALNTRGSWKGEITNRSKSGALISEFLTITAIKNKSGQIERYVAVFSDISQLKATQEELHYLANYDPLTKLPNRNRFISEVNDAIAQSQRSGLSFAVLILGVDSFSKINESYSPEYGDEALKALAERLKKTARTTDVVARLSGDLFAVLLNNLQQYSQAGRVADKLISNSQEPVVLSNNATVMLSYSIGISVYPQNSQNANALLQHADTALHSVKTTNKGRFAYFSSAMTDITKKIMAIEEHLKRAIQRNELELHYQPQINIQKNTLSGAEALLRWTPSDFEKIPVWEFIPIAEESELIAEIGDWVLLEACKQAKIWFDNGYTEFLMAVNVSPKQLLYRNIFTSVKKALELSKLPPQNLEIELTENALMNIQPSLLKQLSQLRDLGVRIAIDDFGTGFSSLSYAKSLPINVLKIDKSFIDDVPLNEKGTRIVEAVIAMGHGLGFEVLAEGVENNNQKNFLAAKGCDKYQGYLKGRPVKAQEFEKRYLTVDNTDS